MGVLSDYLLLSIHDTAAKVDGLHVGSLLAGRRGSCGSVGCM